MPIKKFIVADAKKDGNKLGVGKMAGSIVKSAKQRTMCLELPLFSRETTEALSTRHVRSSERTDRTTRITELTMNLVQNT